MLGSFVALLARLLALAGLVGRQLTLDPAELGDKGGAARRAQMTPKAVGTKDPQSGILGLGQLDEGNLGKLGNRRRTQAIPTVDHLAAPNDNGVLNTVLTHIGKKLLEGSDGIHGNNAANG